MANGFNRLQSSYSIALNEGYAVLSRMAGRNPEWPHPNSGNVDEEIMLDAVYGGSANPEVPGEYTVYSVDWLDEIPDESDEEALKAAQDIADGAAARSKRVSGEPTEEFRRYLDDNFKGWVYHHGRGEVFVIADDSDEDYPHQHDL
jgi:hypothetical protein